MSEILERGGVYVLYRPRVDQEEPSGLEDVQRLLLVLQPERQDRVRMVIVGRKSLPQVADGVQERHWAFVAGVAPSGENLRDELDRKDYRTGRGEPRTQPAARAVAEGVYALVRHGDHTHLAYRLELPNEPGEVQAELRIAPEASYVVAVKNPDARSAAGPATGLPAYPEPLRDRFVGRRWMPVDPPEFLDFEGTELVLVSASEDVEGELGIRLEPEGESTGTAEILRDLPLAGEDALAPLLRGEWS